MELQGFINEGTLNELLDNEKISTLEYIWHHSQEMKDDFMEFCHARHFPVNEKMALKYMDYRLELENNGDI